MYRDEKVVIGALVEFPLIVLYVNFISYFFFLSLCYIWSTMNLYHSMKLRSSTFVFYPFFLFSPTSSLVFLYLFFMPSTFLIFLSFIMFYVVFLLLHLILQILKFFFWSYEIKVLYFCTLSFFSLSSTSSFDSLYIIFKSSSLLILLSFIISYFDFFFPFSSSYSLKF